MNDGSVSSLRSFLRTLSVQTKLVAVFLIFFLCAIAPSAATWVFLHQQMPGEASPTTERSSRPAHKTTVPLFQTETSIRPRAPRSYENGSRGFTPARSTTSPRDAVSGPFVDRMSARPDEPPQTTQQAAASYEQTVGELIQFWGAAVLVLVGIGGLLLYLVRHHVVLPLIQLKREAVTLANGAPGASITVRDREDEIGVLARALRKIKTPPQAEREQTEQGASASDPGTPLNPSIVRLDEERRVVASESLSIAYNGPSPSGDAPEERETEWTVRPDQQNGISAISNAAGENTRMSDAPPEDGDGAQTGVRYDDFMAIVHPQDRDQLRDRQEQALEKGVPIDLEYRIVHPGGEERFVRERGMAEIGKDGAPARFSGQVLDVTEQKSKEQQIERLQEDYDALLASIPEALLVVEAASSEILEANEAAAALFDTSVEEILGQPQSVLYPPDTVQEFEAIFEEARRRTGSGPETIRHFDDGSPLRVATHTGEEVPVVLTVTTIERENRTFFSLVFHDRTEEQALEDRLHTFEQAVAQSGDMILMTDTDGTILYANPAAEAITGYEQEELIGEDPSLLQSGEISKDTYQQLWSTLEEGDVFRGTLTDRRKDGSIIELDQTITPIQDETGEVSHYVSTGRDVTDQVERKAELRRRKEALRERETRLRGLANSIPGVVYQFFARPDGTHGTHFVSEHSESILGIAPDPEEGFFEAFIERVPTTHRDELLASIDEALEAETSWSFEIPYEHPSGERMWVLGTSTPERREDEVIFNGVLLDITDRKKAEQASKEERDRFETLFESLPTPVVHCTLEANKTLIADVNEAFENVFGVEADAIEGKDVNELLVPEDTEAEEEAAQIEHRALSRGTQQLEVRRQTSDGIRDFQLQASGRVSESSSAELYAIYTDITEQKEREERLQRRHQKIESLYAATSRLLIAERGETVYRRIHEVLEDVFDYTVTATGFVDENDILFAETSVSDACQVSCPEAVPTTGDSVSARALRTRETVVVDGESAPDWGPDEGDLASMASIPIGKHGVVTIGQRRREDFNSFDLRLVAVLGTYAAVVLDRLEREQELRAAKEEAEDASEFKSVMLANISHEIRTPLTAINGFSEVLAGELSAPHDDLAERVHQSGKRLMKTFESVLQLSKLEAGTRELDRERAALDQIVKNVVSKWESTAKDQSITLETDLPDSPVHDYWDTDIVGRIAENLLENAIKFTPEDGRVEVRVLNEGEIARVEVEDTGIGIGEQFRPDMFQAFKQESEGLNREYEGAGLGLAVTKQAVDHMGGRIEVDTQKGEGSTFTVRLPMGA